MASPHQSDVTHVSRCLVERGEVACVQPGERAAASAQRRALYGHSHAPLLCLHPPQNPLLGGLLGGRNLHRSVPDSAPAFSSKHDEALLGLTWEFQWLLRSSPASVVADFSVAAESCTPGLWEQESSPRRALLMIMILPEMLAESLCQWNGLW